MRTSRPEITILYDGECPLCAREIAMLRRLDRGRGAIGFTDITRPAFDATALGLDQDLVMARIHGVRSDGSLVEGVEVFRLAYAAVGLRWLVAPTRWPGLRQLADAAYTWFARNRLRLTGRSAVCSIDRSHAPAVEEGRPDVARR